MVMEIPLSRGMAALVDDLDFDRVSAVGKWYANPSDQTFYARKNFWSGGRCLSIRMHTLITGWDLVDHANGNGLDNRRDNLRLCSQTQNSQNRGRRSDNTSGFKGVSRHRKRWTASIQVNGKSIYLGLFDTAESAAVAYDDAAHAYFGEFARTNFHFDSSESAA